MGKKKEEYEGPELSKYRDLEQQASDFNALLLIGITVLTFLSLLAYRC